jgi:hypothetical protein
MDLPIWGSEGDGSLGDVFTKVDIFEGHGHCECISKRLDFRIGSLTTYHVDLNARCQPCQRCCQTVRPQGSSW